MEHEEPLGVEARFEQRFQRIAVGALVLGFAGRVAWQLRLADYFASGYSHFFGIARSLLAGEGFPSALRPPIYPLFLAAASLGGVSSLSVIALQAALGCGTAYLAYAIARALFDRATALCALTLVSLYPYYVAHDGALQETTLHTFLVAAAVHQTLYTLRTPGRHTPSLWAGLWLGLAWMTRASTLPFIVLLVGRIALRRVRAALVVAAVCFAVACPWLIRNQLRLGAPIATSHSGYLLFVAHNPHTFDFYPERSIDLSAGASYGALSAAEKERLAGLPELARDRAFQRLGLSYLFQDPVRAARAALVKLSAGFSPWLNPTRDALAQLAYAIGYVPLLLLGALGLARAPKDPIFLLLPLAFCAVTALFWAHTSHRAHLDIYLAIFAASVLTPWLRKLHLPVSR
jgi:4-amino-4-deoxy-L-arabinose transferase-like glycosyltransferase